jgi:hypothetical protein
MGTLIAFSIRERTGSWGEAMGGGSFRLHAVSGRGSLFQLRKHRTNRWKSSLRSICTQ